jgi:hypothetical protein
VWGTQIREYRDHRVACVISSILSSRGNRGKRTVGNINEDFPRLKTGGVDNSAARVPGSVPDESESGSAI